MAATIDQTSGGQGMKRLLILIDGSDNDRASLATAVAAAGALGARLRVGFARTASDNRVVAANAERHAGEAFDDVCGSLDNAEFHFYGDGAAATLTAAGHGFDLLIVERVSREQGPESETLNAALFDSGRPVLLAPPSPPANFPSWAAVAWNGSPQAARAVAAALPLLAQAQGVTLLVGSRESDLSTEHIAAYLAAHGVKAELGAFESAGMSARARGRALLAAIRELDAGLLVTGAYGENRRNSIFGLGRATQKIATAAPIPVLLHS